MERSISAALDAPPQRIWDILVDDPAALDPAIVAFDVEPAPGPGAVNRITFRGPFGLRLPATSLVEVWEPPHRYVAQSLTPSWPVRSRVEDVLEEQPDGTTRYTVTVSVEPRPLTGPIGRLWLRFIMRTRTQMMDRLQGVLERP
jgi:uncharacterized protein YndB with AHSA1/START domain